ncbi:MAG: tetratricopeptide repeat protein [Halothece sp.]
MFEEIASAIAQQDYTTANQILDTLKPEYPDHPWLLFYTAQIQQANGETETARRTYQSLLQTCSNRKLLSQTREAIRQLETNVNEKDQQVIQEALAQPGGKELAVFVLTAIPSEEKKAAAQTLATTFQIDPYNARLQLPSRGWRLFRLGAMGEFIYYTKVLQQAHVPCFSLPLSKLDTLYVFQVQYLRCKEDIVTARCSLSNGQEGNLTFQWSEISAKVQGRVPIFEEIITKNNRGKKQRKRDVLDYVQLYDLHLPQRRAILRLCDQKYQFHQSDSLTEKIQKGETLRRNWLQLLQFLEEKLPEIDCWHEFTSFGESAIAFPQMLSRISPHIQLQRRYDTVWDAAFQLYSGLIFFQAES